MFKNYHIVIFKDREGGCRNLRLSGWFGVALLLLLAGLAAMNFYLWGFYSKSAVLQYELEEAEKIIQSHDSQLLSLAGKLQSLEEDVARVQQFDAKLRVLTNIDQDTADTEDGSESKDGYSGVFGTIFSDPALLSRHRELFNRRMHSLVDELAQNAQLEEVKQQYLITYLSTNKDSMVSIPTIWPVKGYLTSGFGPRKAPMAGASRMHKGLDISNRIGTPVRAPARGTVTFTGMDGAYGICIVLDHGNGIVTRYAHLQKSSVREGEQVNRGDVIGALGNTGRSTGPHLHYEVIVNGIHVNPIRYILN